MSVRLYHGSEVIVESPEFGKGARHNDMEKASIAQRIQSLPENGLVQNRRMDM